MNSPDDAKLARSSFKRFRAIARGEGKWPPSIRTAYYTGFVDASHSSDLEEIIHLLDEARGFAALSPEGRDNIDTAISLLLEAQAKAGGPANFAGCCNSTDIAACDCVNKDHVRVNYVGEDDGRQGANVFKAATE